MNEHHRPPKKESFHEWMAKVDRQVEAEYQAARRPAPGRKSRKAPSIPQWLIENPGTKDSFDLTMFDEEGCVIASQTVALTAREFIALKHHLAIMRGLIKDQGASNA